MAQLSEELKSLLIEAQSLLQLKADFGRLPNGNVKSYALMAIEQWFNAENDDKTQKGKSPVGYVTSGGRAGLSPEETLEIKSPTLMFLNQGDNVPDDDEIPF
jgi:hypothetical protein